MSRANELAEELDAMSERITRYSNSPGDGLCDEAATELRRLHARSEEQERLLRDALEALESISGDVCDYVHHAKKDRHAYGEVCPVHGRHTAAIAAIRKHLGEQT